jgi:hypothetical protein
MIFEAFWLNNKLAELLNISTQARALTAQKVTKKTLLLNKIAIYIPPEIWSKWTKIKCSNILRPLVTIC